MMSAVQCGSGGAGECYSEQQTCDFIADCWDQTDEAGCPLMFLFDDCQLETGSDTCGWTEDPRDDLDWVVAGQNDTQGGDHPIQRGGKFLWIQKSGESAAARAHVESPVYQNSRVDCYVMFYYVKSGTIG